MTSLHPLTPADEAIIGHVIRLAGCIDVRDGLSAVHVIAGTRKLPVGGDLPPNAGGLARAGCAAARLPLVAGGGFKELVGCFFHLIRFKIGRVVARGGTRFG